MPACPYCHQPIEMIPENIPMSFKRRAVFDFVRDGGPAGVQLDELRAKFFPAAKDNTIRTTIHYINRAIKPMAIRTLGGIVRLVNEDPR